MKPRKWLPALRSYVQRILRWLHLINQVRGIEASDRDVIRRSCMWALIDCWRFPLVWRDPLLLADATVHVKGVGQFYLRAETDDLWHVYPAREPEVFAQISDVLRPGDVFIDAGANIGFYSVLASRRVGPSGRVLAIEMMPGTAERLRGHLTVNGCENTEVVEAALSDAADQFVDAFLPRGQSGQASLTRNRDHSDTIRVRTTTLDSVAGQIESVRLLKMDLEGAELQALQGARRLLERVDAICFEDRDGESQVRPFLEGIGFTITPLGNADVLAVRNFG